MTFVRLAPAKFAVGLFILAALASSPPSSADQKQAARVNSADRPSPFLTPPAPGQVRTLAGSGRVGLRDGDALSAEFMQLSGLAFDAAGRLYIADRAAQRIRMYYGGRVTTVAGSGAPDETGAHVQGGYLDGPALEARFNEPTGVAVGLDGSLLVADELNHCIRRIADGVVSTFAGAPNRNRTQDGPGVNASFHYPRSITIDGAGVVYVGDYGTGVRKIDRDGTVSTLPMANVGGKKFTGISAWGSGDRLTLFAADQQDLTEAYRPSVGQMKYWNSVETRLTIRPYGIVAVNDTEALAADAVGSYIYLFRIPEEPFITQPYAGVVAGSDHADSVRNLGYQDGPADQARFSNPVALAVRGSEVVIADAGNRRLRIMPMPSAVRRAVGNRPEELSADPSHYRILYISSSHAFYSSNWSNSIGGLIESKLTADRLRLGIARPPLVSVARIDGGDFAKTAEYVTNFAGDGQMDLVIMSLTFGVGSAQEFVDGVRKLNTRLSGVGTRLVLAIQPLHQSFPREAFIDHEEYPFPDTKVMTFDYSSPRALERETIALVKTAGVPYVAPFDEFEAFEKNDPHVSLYSPNEGHFNAYGNAFYARCIVDALVKLRPWAQSRGR